MKRHCITAVWEHFSFVSIYKKIINGKEFLTGLTLSGKIYMS